MAPQPIHLMALRGSVKDEVHELPAYAEREAAFRLASPNVKRPWGAGSLETSKCVDANRLETIMNLITCIPYNAAAFWIPRW